MRLVADPVCVVSGTEHVTLHPMPAVEHERVAEVEELHPGRHRTVVDVDQQVVMGVEQAVRNACPLDSRGYPRELPNEHRAVDIIPEESRRGPDAVGVDVKSTRRLVALAPRHHPTMAAVAPLHQCLSQS